MLALEEVVIKLFCFPVATEEYLLVVFGVAAEELERGFNYLISSTESRGSMKLTKNRLIRERSPQVVMQDLFLIIKFLNCLNLT
jgi:hypothetical protein